MTETNPFVARQQKKIEDRSRCDLCRQIHGLSKTRMKSYYEALKDRNVDVATILELLGEWGITTSRTTLSIHRNERRTHGKCMERLRKAVS